MVKERLEMNPKQSGHTNPDEIMSLKLPIPVLINNF